MRSELRYLVFGLLVLASYWFVVQRGIVFVGGDSAPSPPSARVRVGSGPRPSFWSTGYQGGK